MSIAQYSKERRHLFYDQPKPFSNNQLQIVKLFDGLFLGNQHAGKELQFLSNNKITIIINLAHHEVHPLPHKYITILNYDFTPKKGEQEERLNIFPILEIMAKMDYCLHTKYEGIVIIAKNIESKAITFATVYLMIKYRWNFMQAYAYIQHKYPHAQILQRELVMLQNFDKNSERDKLSEAFDTQFTHCEEELIQNTLQNSHVINMPDFHGLNFMRTEMLGNSRIAAKKVKFSRQIEEVIGSKEHNRKDSAILSPKLNDAGKKLTNVEKKLRQFIKEKCQMREEIENASFKPIKTQKSGEDMMLIKSKDIICRIPRKRAASKTEQSPISYKQAEKIRENNFLSFEFKQQDSFMKKSENLKTVIPTLEMQVNLVQKSRTIQAEEDDSEPQRKEKGTIIHNNKRYRIPKKCLTEQSIISSYLNPTQIKPDTSPERKKDTSAGNYLFKISKSSKNSYKKFKINTLVKPTISKESQKCIKIVEQDSYQKREQPQIFAQIIHEKQSYKKHKIINLNLNVQIENINYIHERSERETSEDQKKIFTRTYHPKKISRIVLNQEEKDF